MNQPWTWIDALEVATRLLNSFSQEGMFSDEGEVEEATGYDVEEAADIAFQGYRALVVSTVSCRLVVAVVVFLLVVLVLTVVSLLLLVLVLVSFLSSLSSHRCWQRCCCCFCYRPPPSLTLTAGGFSSTMACDIFDARTHTRNTVKNTHAKKTPLACARAAPNPPDPRTPACPSLAHRPCLILTDYPCKSTEQPKEKHRCMRACVCSLLHVFFFL